MFWPLAMAVISLRMYQAFSLGGERIDLESEMMKARACVAGGAMMSINMAKKRSMPRVGRTAHTPNWHDHIHITQTKRTKLLSILPVPGILLGSVYYYQVHLGSTKHQKARESLSSLSVTASANSHAFSDRTNDAKKSP
jgi:hypothetical protein